MAQVRYEVPLVWQAANPICWVCSCAMVESWGTNVNTGVSKYTGFDPSNSCIPNPANDWDGCVQFMNKWGFDVYSSQGLADNGFILTVDDLGNALSSRGPIVLLHFCKDFPYGSQWGPVNDPNAAHAVVITGVDSNQGIVWFNNPWGDKDQVAVAQPVLDHINLGGRQNMGFWRSTS
ncbi:MAG: papain-like cysteine protease family protein [Syntrophobacteraceae bacterium]|nr:papain-like cysteine protease family protein [Syntrophobacteraceae bacterium]